MAPNIGVILGTMTFGWSSSSSSIDKNLAGQMLDVYFNAGLASFLPCSSIFVLRLSRTSNLAFPSSRADAEHPLAR